MTGHVDARLPRLTDDDVMLLGGLLVRARPDAPQRLADALDDIDYLQRWLPGYDDLSFGLQRLAAHGLVNCVPVEDGILLRPTERTVELRHASTEGLMLRLEATRSQVGEDRSLGRCPDLSEAIYEAAVKEYRRSFTGEGGMAESYLRQRRSEAGH